MEECQPSSFHIKHFNQSVMTRCCRQSVWLETSGLAGAVVSAEVETAASGGVNPHLSCEREQDAMLGAQGPATSWLAAPHTANRAQ